MAHQNLTYLSEGYTATIYHITSTQKICKSFNTGCIENHFRVEKQVYERFSSTELERPQSISKYYGVHETESAGLILDLAANGSVYHYLWDHHKGTPSPINLYRWARQAGEGLAYAHACGIMHCDIHCSNFVLDKDLNLKVIDWAGASINGSRSWSYYRLTHQLPDKTKKYTPHMEIFASGSAMHYMVAGKDLYSELDQEADGDEIVARIKAKDLPDTRDFPVLGEVIRKCWNVEYDTMQDVIKAIKDEEHTQARTSKGML